MLRLLCVANPDRYARSVTDVPLSYARLAAHPQIELYHADTTAMIRGTGTIDAVRVPVGFMPDEFRDLPRRPTTPLSPDAFDIAFDRTLKPFSDGFIDRLELFSAQLTFVNDPSGIRRQLDAAFLLAAASAQLPPSLLTADTSEAHAFFTEHGSVVAKRPNSCGGREVYRITQRSASAVLSENVVEGERVCVSFPMLFAHLSRNGAESVLLMRFLPRVTEGDKRIVVVGGEIYGAYLRTAGDGSWVQNVSLGGRCELVAVSEDDRRLVEATCLSYLEAGINLLGYDLLRGDDGRWLVSEINAGNVGGLFRIEYLGVQGVTDRFVNWLHGFAHRSKQAVTA